MEWFEIDGWCKFHAMYAEQVNRAREGARFVEVGAWKGRSTAAMAHFIREGGRDDIKFWTVDTWKGSKNSVANELCQKSEVPADLKEQFHKNLEACGVSDFVTPIQCDSIKAAEQFEDESLDFVFIDADHDADAVYNDLKAWWPKVRPGGLLAGHDFNQQCPRMGVNRFIAEVGHAVYGDGSANNAGYECYGIPKPIAEDVKILLALPHYDGRAYVASLMMACGYAYSGNGAYTPTERGTSLLAQNFNGLWSQALNEGYTHFAMLHADIMPSRWWLDVLMHEMCALDLRMISAVVPIKDETGITSTGIANREIKHWAPLRRFTMSEVLEMPATFNAEQAGYPGRHLILNTGCWLADLRDDRWKIMDENNELYCHFEIRDRITKHEGTYVCWTEPEDFFFSNRVQNLGMSVAATRKVKVEHIGNIGFPNDKPWGSWKQDEATRDVWENVPQVIGA